MQVGKSGKSLPSCHGKSVTGSHERSPCVMGNHITSKFGKYVVTGGNEQFMSFVLLQGEAFYYVRRKCYVQAG